jgi:hypothetical protein
MKGIQYVIDEAGEKTAVVIDLKEYGELWEDFYDRVVVDSRKDEPRKPLASVVAGLRRHGKLDA